MNFPAAINRRRFLVTGSGCLFAAGTSGCARAQTLSAIDVTAPPFNADPTGTKNSTGAFAAAAAAINRAGGGKLIIPPGTYRVGRQTRTRRGAQWAYRPDSIIEIRNCTQPVEISGEGARLVCDRGLRYGSFDPDTGGKAHPRLPFTDLDYRASPYTAMIGLYDNRAPVVVLGLELDGNARSLEVGGPWNDAGIQINASGIEAMGNREVEVRGIYSHDHALDGIMIGFPGLTSAHAPHPHRIIGCRFVRNARQGLSWVGGNSLTVRDSSFTQTGRGPFASAPGAGVDIEAEQAVCRNGLFERCDFADNSGVAFQAHASSDNAGVRCVDCSFSGTSSWAAWPASPAMRFEDCKFRGGVTNAYGSKDEALATQFSRCSFTAVPGHSYRGNFLTIEVDSARGVLFDHCTADSGGDTSKPVVYISGDAIVRDCSFRQDGPGLSVVRARMIGRNTFSTAGTIDFSGGSFVDPVSVNGALRRG